MSAMDGGGVMITQSPGAAPTQPPGFPRFQAGGRPPFNPRGGGQSQGFQSRNRMDGPMVASSFDGKRMRNRAALRRTIDYNASMINYLENRIWQRDYRDRRALQTDPIYSCQMVPSLNLVDSPVNCVCTRHIRTSANKIRCPIFCVCWTPEGRRLVTGASSGEFTLWNGLTFNFETILQAHDSPVRKMKWSHGDQWMLTGDHAGYVKYWQSNMNNVKMFQAHKDPIRGLSFCPTDQKFASCSDDGTVRIWDFLRCTEEKILRGHGADVKCVDWHPQKSLVASGSKDTQQPLKLWDPRMGESLATIHAHKHTVMEVTFNNNGNWLLTASRDHLLKLFDIRNMKEELQSFRGHKKEATTAAWHPNHEQLFASGGSDGAIMYWMVGIDKEVGNIDCAHDNMVWTLAWHPLGHILVSGSNDHTTKFWARNRPGDQMRDRYNLNLLPKGITDDMLDMDADLAASLPGMGLEFGLPEHLKKEEPKESEPMTSHAIPGLDFDNANLPIKGDADRSARKKVPYAKPVPRDFQQAWVEGKQPLSIQGPPNMDNGAPPPDHPPDNGPPPFKSFGNSGPPDMNGPPQDQDMRQMPPPPQPGGFGGFHGHGHPPPQGSPNKRMREDDWGHEEPMNGGRGRGGFFQRGRGGFRDNNDRGGMRGGWRGGRGGRGGYNGPRDDGPPPQYDDGQYDGPPQRGGFRGGRGNRGNYTWRGPRGGGANRGR